jgi:hypothetical protein
MAESVGDQNTKKGSGSGDKDASHNEAVISPSGVMPLSSATQQNGNANQHACQCCGKENSFNITTLVEIFVGVALVVVGGLQYWVYTRQAGIMDQQTRIAQAEHRPWIYSATPKFSDDLIHDAAGLRMGIEFPLKNTGHSPSRNVLIDLRVSLYGWHGDAAFREICARLEKLSFGSSIFPNDTVPQKAFGLIPEAEFLQRQEEAKSGAQIEHVPPTIIVCIVYKDMETDSFHHTFMALYISGPDENASAIPIVMKHGTIGAQDLRLNVVGVAAPASD